MTWPVAVRTPLFAARLGILGAGPVSPFLSERDGLLKTRHRDAEPGGMSERSLADELVRIHRLVDNALELVVVVGADGAVIDANPACGRLLGYSRDEMLTINAMGIVHPEDLPRIVEQFGTWLDRAAPVPSADIRIRRRDGKWRWFEVHIDVLEEGEGAVYVLNARDVTERRRAEQLLGGQSRVLELIARSAPLVDTVAAASAVVDAQADDGRSAMVVDVGPRPLVVAPELPAEWGADVTIGLIGDAAAADGLDAWLGTLAVEHGLGSGWSIPIRERDGRDLGRILVYRDDKRPPSAEERRALDAIASLVAIAVDRQATEAQLAHQADHDMLTGLLDRNGFVKALEAVTEEHGSPSALLFVDLDEFKELNDEYGHRIGDRVLVEVARRLRVSLRRSDVLARFGGDEFVAVLNRSTEDEAARFADRFLDALAAPIVVDGQSLRVNASIGIAAPSDTGTDAAELLHQADLAMYRAKSAGRARVARFEHPVEVDPSEV